MQVTAGLLLWMEASDMDIDRYDIHWEAGQLDKEPDGEYCYWSDVEESLTSKDTEIERLRHERNDRQSRLEEAQCTTVNQRHEIERLRAEVDRLQRFGEDKQKEVERLRNLVAVVWEHAESSLRDPQLIEEIERVLGHMWEE